MGANRVVAERDPFAELESALCESRALSHMIAGLVEAGADAATIERYTARNPAVIARVDALLAETSAILRRAGL